MSEACANVVLLVEDDRELREELAGSLRERSFEVIEAADGPTALALIREHMAAIDWLVTDIRLGGISGIHVAFEFRYLNPIRPIIFITAFDVPAAAERVPVTVVLRKPFRIRNLLDLMDSFRLDQSMATLGA